MATVVNDKVTWTLLALTNFIDYCCLKFYYLQLRGFGFGLESRLLWTTLA